MPSINPAAETTSAPFYVRIIQFRSRLEIRASTTILSYRAQQASLIHILCKRRFKREKGEGIRRRVKPSSSSALRPAPQANSASDLHQHQPGIGFAPSLSE